MIAAANTLKPAGADAGAPSEAAPRLKRGLGEAFHAGPMSAADYFERYGREPNLSAAELQTIRRRIERTAPVTNQFELHRLRQRLSELAELAEMRMECEKAIAGLALLGITSVDP